MGCGCNPPDLSGSFTLVSQTEVAEVETIDTTPTALNLKDTVKLPQTVILPRKLVSGLHQAGVVVPRSLQITSHDMRVPAAVRAYLVNDVRYSAWFEPESITTETDDTEPEPVTASEATASDGDALDYEALTTAELNGLLDLRGIVLESGTGSNGNVVKADMVAALVAWDEAQSA